MSPAQSPAHTQELLRKCCEITAAAAGPAFGLAYGGYVSIAVREPRCRRKLDDPRLQTDQGLSSLFLRCLGLLKLCFELGTQTRQDI